MDKADILKFVMKRNGLGSKLLSQVYERSDYKITIEKPKKEIILDLIEQFKGNVWLNYITHNELESIMKDIQVYCLEHKGSIEYNIRDLGAPQQEKNLALEYLNRIII
jgi:hypothetical protein